MEPSTYLNQQALQQEIKGKIEELKQQSPELTRDKLSKRVEHMVSSGGGFSLFDLERLIGANDLVKRNYLERGLLASNAVCRIYAPDALGFHAAWGTGFLISPQLLITNNHVIETMESAAVSFAEFEYETDLNGVLKQGKRFRLRPDLSFITSEKELLDFTIVAIDPISEDGTTALDKYGFLRLIGERNKVLESEFVTIIQHPNGDQKYIALRENKVVKIGDDQPATFKDNFIWYASDTAKGSSGSPTFNDNWQVVAMHHKGVRSTRLNESTGLIEVELMNGTWITEEEAKLVEEEKLRYIANEGIRISSVVRETVKKFNDLAPEGKIRYAALKEFIDDATGVRPFPGTAVKESINVPARVFEKEVIDGFEARRVSRNIRPVSYYAGRKGYDASFLTTDIPLPELTQKALRFGQPVQTSTGDDVLHYTHFSVCFNGERKLAFYTAVNIDGRKWRNIKRGDDKWFYDPRIPIELQVDDELYGREPKDFGKKGYFDRGHLVRRQDPDWGNMETAALADEDTFHWTNCSPQYWGFNQGQDLWQGLENYILYNTDQENVKATVFTGPVFSTDDEVHRGVHIPAYFWKIVVVNDSAGQMYSAGYVVSQKEFAREIPFEEIPVGNFNQFQVKIAKIESLTGLRFDRALTNVDVLLHYQRDMEGMRSLADIKFGRRK
ncbi:MAG TPA: DNA/RNA non-specific endonuclease [Flavisolibacter sp.]|jgi:endonuclease G|nr:DNA/RNA non-specific endonuclease [Flavisolibacter sp.]